MGEIEVPLMWQTENLLIEISINEKIGGPFNGKNGTRVGEEMGCPSMAKMGNKENRRCLNGKWESPLIGKKTGLLIKK